MNAINVTIITQAFNTGNVLTMKEMTPPRITPNNWPHTGTPDPDTTQGSIALHPFLAHQTRRMTQVVLNRAEPSIELVCRLAAHLRQIRFLSRKCRTTS